MKVITNILLATLVFTFAACDQQPNKINIREGIRSDDLANNIVTRPVAYAFSVISTDITAHTVPSGSDIKLNGSMQTA
jgi:hypothetical protein